jgi:hypothetical protein
MYNNLEFIEVLKTKGISEDNFANFPTKNALTCSFLDDTKGEFSLVFKAKKDGKLSEMLHLSSNITKAEAYNLEEAKLNIELIFNRNSGVNSTNSLIGGYIRTESQAGINGVRVVVTATSPLSQSFNTNIDTTDNFGFFNLNFGAIPLGANAILTPIKNDSFQNGISTFDLLLISKHILGVQPLASPYKMIAADVNKSGSVTSFDLVELRKLILGIYTEFPANTSWRFVDKNFVFPNPQNPFSATFPETRTISSIQTNQDSYFIGFKVGDVNGSAAPNYQAISEERNTENLPFYVRDQVVEKGKIYTIHFAADDFVEGYQFTLEYPNLSLLKITPCEGMEADNFAIFEGKNLLSTSYIGNKKGEFDLTFVAEKDGQLSDLLKISSQITKAEAYTLESQKDIELRFLPKNDVKPLDFTFEISPNPIIEEALVTFNLPEKSVCTLSIFDNLGRLLWEEKKEFLEGENRFSFKPESKGILLFQLETPFTKIVKKVIK